MAGERQFVVAPARALYDTRLDASAKLVLMVLGSRTNKDGACWPAVETVAREASLSVRTVKRSLQLLEEAGWIARVRRGRGLTTITKVIYDRPTSELVAEYAETPPEGASEGDTNDWVEGPEDADLPQLDENKKCHSGPSEHGAGVSGATVAPPEVPHRPLEGCQGRNSSSSSRDLSTRDDNAHAEGEDAGSEASGQIAESRGRGEVAPSAETAAALRAPDSAPPPPVADDPDQHIGLASRFPDADHRAAYLAYRRGHRFPTAYDAELRTLNEPMTGGQPVPWDVIGRQLLQLQGNGEAFNARLLAGYCRSAMAARERPAPRPSSRGQDKSTATRSEFLRLVDQPEERAS